MTAWQPKDFLEKLAPRILENLKPPLYLKEFTRNPAIVGEYVEAGVRQLIRRYLAPSRPSLPLGNCVGYLKESQTVAGRFTDQQLVSFKTEQAV